MPAEAGGDLDVIERMFYTPGMGVEYREEPCRNALNRVKGMGFGWSLNPYMGCAHRCTFCYVRAFEQRADRPADDRYGRSIRVKVNMAEVLRRELARPSWQRRGGCDRRRHRPVPAGRRPLQTHPRLPRGPARRREPVQPDHAQPDDRPRPRRARRGGEARGGRSRLLGADPRRGGLAAHRARNASPAPPARGGAALVDAGIKAGSGWPRSCPASPTRPSSSSGRPGRARGRRDERLGEPSLPQAGHTRALPRRARARLAGGTRPL